MGSLGAVVSRVRKRRAMSTKPNAAGYRVLKSLTGPLHEAIAALTTAEIVAALEALNELANNNCDWFTYCARGFLAQALDDWLQDRRDSLPCKARVHGRAPTAYVRSNGEAVCRVCSLRWRLTSDELSALDRAADEKWTRKADAGEQASE
jgi:hypothetical protein